MGNDQQSCVYLAWSVNGCDGNMTSVMGVPWRAVPPALTAQPPEPQGQGARTLESHVEGMME